MITENKEKKLEHLCEANHYPDAQVLFEQINASQSAWILYETWAIQEDSELGSLSETLSSHTLLVNYCPFCGVELENIKAPVW